MTKKKSNTSKDNSKAIGLVPQSIDYDKFVVDVKYTDKGGFRISLDMLEKLFQKARLAGKLPLLKIGIKKSELEIFLVDCQISIEKK